MKLLRIEVSLLSSSNIFGTMAAIPSIRTYGMPNSQTSSTVKQDRIEFGGSFIHRGITRAPARTFFKIDPIKSQVFGRKPTKTTNRIEKPRYAVGCRAARDDYGNCKCIEDAVTLIVTDALQHCLGTENDAMRQKVINQMGKGLAALIRVSTAVAAESTAPIQMAIPEFSTIAEDDLEQVQRMLKLTSLPFQSTYDHDLNHLMEILQTSDRQGRKLRASDLSQICERLASDMVQCLGPLAMCFSQLPLWAKHRALLLPAQMASSVAFNLLAGPDSR